MCASFAQGDYDSDPVLVRFASRENVEQMRKVFFTTEPNGFGHSYRDRIRGPRGRCDLSDVIELLDREPLSKRAAIVLAGEGDGRVPCINAVHFLRRCVAGACRDVLCAGPGRLPQVLRGCCMHFRNGPPRRRCDRRPGRPGHGRHQFGARLPRRPGRRGRRVGRGRRRAGGPLHRATGRRNERIADRAAKLEPQADLPRVSAGGRPDRHVAAPGRLQRNRVRPERGGPGRRTALGPACRVPTRRGGLLGHYARLPGGPPTDPATAPRAAGPARSSPGASTPASFPRIFWPTGPTPLSWATAASRWLRWSIASAAAFPGTMCRAWLAGWRHHVLVVGRSSATRPRGDCPAPTRASSTATSTICRSTRTTRCWPRSAVRTAARSAATLRAGSSSKE